MTGPGQPSMTAQLSQILVVGELVPWGEDRVGLAVPLDLGDLEERLPAKAQAQVRQAEGLAGAVAQRELPGVAEVRVVRDGQDFAAGKLLIAVEEAPEFLGIRAIDGGERQDPVHGRSAVLEDDHPMAAGVLEARSPLVADERRETPRFVVLLGHGGDVVPDRAPEPFVPNLRIGPRDADDELGHRIGRRAVRQEILQFSVEAFAGFCREQHGVRRPQPVGDPEILGVVGDDQEVERAAQPRFHAVVRDHRTAARHHVCGVRPQVPVAAGACVHRQLRVQVGVSPEHAVRVSPRRRVRGVGGAGKGEERGGGSREQAHRFGIRRVGCVEV